jgi:antiphage defense system Thoeris ThsB-like protein
MPRLSLVPLCRKAALVANCTMWNWNLIYSLPPRAFISFDYDNDSALRDLLIGHSKHPDTNFQLHDWSVKEPFAPSNWKQRIREKIRASDLVIVICGTKTHTATGRRRRSEVCPRRAEAILPLGWLFLQELHQANLCQSRRQIVQLDLGKLKTTGKR